VASYAPCAGRYDGARWRYRCMFGARDDRNPSCWPAPLRPRRSAAQFEERSPQSRPTYQLAPPRGLAVRSLRRISQCPISSRRRPAPLVSPKGIARFLQ